MKTKPKKLKRIILSKEEKAAVKSSRYFTELVKEYKDEPTNENALWVVAIILGLHRYSSEDLNSQELLVDGIYYGLKVADYFGGLDEQI